MIFYNKTMFEEAGVKLLRASGPVRGGPGTISWKRHSS